MKDDYHIIFVGCKDTTSECMSSLIKAGYIIDLLITIPPPLAEKNKVAGYMDLTQFALNNNIETYICDSYALKSETDRKNLGDINIDLMLVIGWQRIIPEWLLDKIAIGAFGMHGSSKALPFGRGRSPLNWSIIQNKDLFITNLFKYNPGVDDGDILATQIFDINPFDTGKSLHYKNTISMIKLLKENMGNLLQNKINLKKQLDIIPTYYPKRTADDGIIFWENSTKDIYNLIRAVTKPFPGAFTFIDNSKITIWKAFPFDTRLFDPYLMPGLLLHVFQNGDFIVKTGDGTLIIQDYEIPVNIKIQVDKYFNSSNYSYKNLFLYPE